MAAVSISSPPLHSPLALPGPGLDVRFNPSSSPQLPPSNLPPEHRPSANGMASGTGMGGGGGGAGSKAQKPNLNLGALPPPVGGRERQPSNNGGSLTPGSGRPPHAPSPGGNPTDPSRAAMTSAFVSSSKLTPSPGAPPPQGYHHYHTQPPGSPGYPFPAHQGQPPPGSPSQHHHQGSVGLPSFVQHPSYHPHPHSPQAYPAPSPSPAHHHPHPHHQPFPQQQQQGVPPHLMMQAYQQQQAHFQQQLMHQHAMSLQRSTGAGQGSFAHAPAGMPWAGPPGAMPPFVTGPPHMPGGSYQMHPHAAPFPSPTGTGPSYHPHHRPRPSVSGSDPGYPAAKAPSPGAPPHPMYMQNPHRRGSSTSVSSASSGRPTPPSSTVSSVGGPIDPRGRMRTESASSEHHRAGAGFPPRVRTESQASSAASSIRSVPSSSVSNERSPTPRSGVSGGAPSIASSAGTVTGAGGARKPSPLAQSALAAAKRAHERRESVDEGEDDDQATEDNGSSETTTSEAERKPGHRSTPGTSVDSTASANKGTPAGIGQPAAAADRELRAANLHKAGKTSLSNRLRRALSMGAMQAAAAAEAGSPTGEGGHSPVDPSRPRLASSAASIAGVPSSNSGSASSSSRRFGLLNSKANSSTDNLSISSTVSSASFMIRKLGNVGRNAKRNSVMGLSKLFKDKDRGEGSTGGAAGAAAPPSAKNFATSSVAQVTAEVDRVGTDYSGMTPAAAFMHKQKQHFAEQEKKAAAAEEAAQAARKPLAQSSANVQGGKGAGTVVGKSKTAEDAVPDAKRKMIEKEKEKLKSRKGGRRWGFGTGSFSVGSGGEAAKDANQVMDEQRRPLTEVGDLGELDDRTPRGSVEVLNDDRGSLRQGIGGRPGEVSYFDDDASSRYEELGSPFGDANETEVLDEYDAASLRMDGSGKVRPRPAREALPKKGILKNAFNFSQEDHLLPRRNVDNRNRSTSFDSSAAPPLQHQRSGLSSPGAGGALTHVITASETEALVDGVLPEHHHRSASPIAPIPSHQSPYAQPGLNASAPILAAPSAPMPARSATSPPVARRATFAQNLSVHTTWPPAVYDRRGEPATCNRLTPALAQRIKEELNEYKLAEMEVHYSSRSLTHFFS